MKVCLGCLSHDSKMFRMQTEDLLYYQQLFGETRLLKPQACQLMCWECMALLKKFTHFAKKCLRAKNAFNSLKNNLNAKVLSKARQVLKLESNLTGIQTFINFETVNVKEEFEENTVLDNDDEAFFEASQNEEKDINNERKQSKIKENTVFNEDVEKEDSIESDASEFTCLENLEIVEAAVKKDVKQAKRKDKKELKNKIRKRKRIKKKTQIVLRNEELRKSFHIISFTQEEIALVMLKKRKEMEESKAPYKCQLCFKIFISERTYTNHWKLNHDSHEAIGDLVCDFCGVRRKRTALTSHLRSHMFEFRCKLCTFTATQITRARQHKLLHQGVTYICEFCGKVSKQMNVHCAHLHSAHNASKFHCLCCGQNFSSQLGQQVHVRKNALCLLDVDVTQLETRQHCEKCDLTFANEDAILKHNRLMHGVKNQDPNEDIGYGFQLRNYKPRRRCGANKTKIDTEKFPCKECGRIYVGKRNYKLHFSAHRPTPKPISTKFYCHKCHKYFSSSYGLRTHDTSIHNPELRPWTCKQCDKTYKTQSALDVHVRSKHSDAKYKCYFCEREYYTSCALSYHIQTFHQKMKKPKRIRNRKKTAKEEVAVTE